MIEYGVIPDSWRGEERLEDWISAVVGSDVETYDDGTVWVESERSWLTQEALNVVLQKIEGGCIMQRQAIDRPTQLLVDLLESLHGLKAYPNDETAREDSIECIDALRSLVSSKGSTPDIETALSALEI